MASKPPFINIGDGKCYLEITGKGQFRWTNYGEQCDECGNDQFSISSNGKLLTCDKCKAEYTIHNTGDNTANSEEDSVMAKATAPAKKTTNRVKANQPGKPKLAVSPDAAPKRERLGIRPAIKAALTKDPAKGVSFAKLLANLQAQFPKIKGDTLSGKIVRHRARLAKSKVKVSELIGAPERGAKKAKAKDDLGI